MFKIFDGRDSFYQWDLNQKLIIEDETIDEVHFSNRTDTVALVCEVYDEDGLRVVNVPNILLQNIWDIRAYGYCRKCYTKQYERFKVIARSKPAGYVYTETELLTVKDFVEEAIVEAIASGNFKGDKGDKGDTGAVKIIPVADFPTENIDENAIYAKAVSNYIGGSGAWVNGAITITTTGFKEVIENVKYFRIVIRNSGNTNIKPTDFPQGALTFVKHDGSIEYPVMVQGTIDNGNIMSSVTTRIYTKDLFFTSQYKEIKLASGYDMWGHFYDGDKFEEYIYIDGAWELIGGVSAEINLDGYVKTTDYATKNKAGLVRVVNYESGLVAMPDGEIMVYQASRDDINTKTQTHKPIVPAYLDYAVKVGVTTNKIALTDEEKAAACEWLGVSNNAGGGTDEVYIGTTEPTDANVEIWINPEAQGTEYATKAYVDEVLGVIENGTY